MSMDMTESIIPRSDQINADDLIAGPITYTVREVIKGVAEHPFDFLLVETDRAYRPSKTMRRVIVNAWGAEAANYAGRRLTLYREPTIKFGGQEVGGIRISHMSHIAGPVEVMAQTTRGKREKFTVEPLSQSADSADLVPAASSPATPVAPEAAQTGAPTILAGNLRNALAALNPHQKKTLFEACGLDPDASTPLKDIRIKLMLKWQERRLPPILEGYEPVPVTLLGAIYEQQASQRDGNGAEAFQHFADTGESIDPGDQAVIA